ncbi:YbhB/YbcL family Raf kinase inhibitor-like protein [bacterium]|nr:YbhB/YbcL family Raf kinase inhibitor-like protein [bacterium]
MKITSSAFEHNQIIPEKFTCDGENINPALGFSDIPRETKSLVLTVDDPDAPAGLWVHWTVWNIAPGMTTIAENSVPEGGIEGVTNYGEPGYGGPCPPDGEHRYFFKLYALDIELDLPKDADKNILEEAMIGHVLDKAELIGLYTRACYETPPCP